MTDPFVDITAETADENSQTARTRRWFAGPPARIFDVVLGINVALTLIAVSAPGTYFQACVAAVVLWICLGLAYLLTLGFTVVRADGVGLRRHWLRWLAVPAIAGATAALVVTAAPVRVGLELAAPAMTAFAKDASAPTPDRVGPYIVDMQNI